MFDDSMTGAVAFAMHVDRLAQARRNMPLNEAEDARSGQRRRHASVSRERVALGLVALAARLAPSLTRRVPEPERWHGEPLPKIRARSARRMSPARARAWGRRTMADGEAIGGVRWRASVMRS
jgi:hypothetical protein